MLYAVFLYTQTVLHHDYFIVGHGADGGEGPASNRLLALSIALLLISLLAVVLLAKKFSLVIDAGKPADALALLGDKPASPAAIEARGDALAALGKQADARAAYTRALAQMDVAAPQRRLVELKLTEVGGSPARTEGSTP